MFSKICKQLRLVKVIIASKWIWFVLWLESIDMERNIATLIHPTSEEVIFSMVVCFYFWSSSYTGFVLEGTRRCGSVSFQVSNIALMVKISYPKMIMMKQPQRTSSIPYYGDIKWTSPIKEEVSCQWWNLNIIHGDFILVWLESQPLCGFYWFFQPNSASKRLLACTLPTWKAYLDLLVP